MVIRTIGWLDAIALHFPHQDRPFVAVNCTGDVHLASGSIRTLFVEIVSADEVRGKSLAIASNMACASDETPTMQAAPLVAVNVASAPAPKFSVSSWCRSACRSSDEINIGRSCIKPSIVSFRPFPLGGGMYRNPM
jgi:hypothetical protein